MHVRAGLDDKGRIMVIGTHNCDNGDAWEREGETTASSTSSRKNAASPWINIIYYLMTH